MGHFRSTFEVVSSSQIQTPPFSIFHTSYIHHVQPAVRLNPMIYSALTLRAVSAPKSNHQAQPFCPLQGSKRSPHGEPLDATCHTLRPWCGCILGPHYCSSFHEFVEYEGSGRIARLSQIIIVHASHFSWLEVSGER